MHEQLYDPENYEPDAFSLLIEEVAQACHEANRVYCASLGDLSQPSWADAPEWQKDSSRRGVVFHFMNPGTSASASHENWFEQKQAGGWSYGPEKDVENKRHPCFVPFEELPAAQQIKDHIFRSTVHAQIEIWGPNFATIEE